MAGKRTTSDSFDELHGLVADSLIEQIKAWRERRLVERAPARQEHGDVEDVNGVQYVVVFPPALLAQAVKFLKDNGIDQPARAGSKVDTLKGEMPDFDDPNIVAFRR
jgi:hypothetical protein